MQEYKVFTAEHDRVVSASFYKDDLLERDPENLNKMKQTLAQFASGAEIEIMDPEVPRTFLLDCSGSMRGRTIAATVAGMVEMGDALHTAGTPFEILGHTTSAWKGGRPHKEWLEQGRPPLPGRLNELLLITVKERDEHWPNVRDNVYGLLHPGLLKENIDGEAITWAAGRMREHESPGQLIVCSDGAPIDDATLAFNEVDLLKDHLAKVLEDEASEGLNIGSVSIESGHGYRQSAYPDAQKALMLDARGHSENTASLIQAMGAAMASHERQLDAEEDALSN